MKRRRWRRRILALVVVCLTAGLAWSAGGGLTITPSRIGIRHTVPLGATGTVTINAGSGGFDGSIVYDCEGTPPNSMTLAGGDGDDPLTIGPNGSQTLSVVCPTTLPVGMNDCQFDLRSGDATVASFVGFCETGGMPLLTASPIPIMPFVSQQVGVQSSAHTVMINNTSQSMTISSLSLRIDNPNFQVGAPCTQTGLGCDDGIGIFMGSGTQVSVFCNPLTAATGTPHQGTLFVVGNNGFSLPSATTLQLSCSTGPSGTDPVLTVDPPSVAIPSPIEVNNDSGFAMVTLANAGTTGNLTIDAITISSVGGTGAGSDWSFGVTGTCMDEEGCVLGPSDDLFVNLTFDPSDFGSRPAQMTIDYSIGLDTHQTSVTLDGFGQGATVELLNEPVALNFGDVPRGVGSEPQSFTLLNTGNRSAFATLNAAPMDPFVFPMMVDVMPGNNEVFVTCFSNTEVTETVTMTIDSTDATATESVTLQCNVIDTEIAATPGSIPLGEIRMQTPVNPVTVTIDRVNAGPTLPLISAALSSANTNLSLGGLSSLMTPAMTTLSITPAQEGPISTSIVITPGSGPTINVPITGNVVTAELTAQPVMTLGTFCIGQDTTGTSVSLESTGTATITVDDVGLLGGIDSPYLLEKLTPQTYPTSLAPAISATVLVTPKPSISAIDVSDDLQWATDHVDVTQTLTAKFVADGGAISPGVLDFGDVPIRIAADNDQAVTMQNCDSEPLVLVRPTVPMPFLLTGSFPQSIAPATGASFSIAFHPTEVGQVEETLSIASAGGDMYQLVLRGNGITDGPGSGSGEEEEPVLDETSFYACGCRSNSNPSGVLAIALALMCALVPRRRKP